MESMVDSTRQPAASDRGNSYKLACFAGVALLAAGCARTVAPAQPSVEAGNLPSCTGLVVPIVMVSRTYLGFFAPHSAVLTERARTIATEFTQSRVIFAEVQGNVDNLETTRRDRGLGLRRAKAMADVLIGLGVPAEGIFLKDFGASRPLVPTPPGVAEPQNRRIALIPLVYNRSNDWVERQKCVDWLNATYCAPNSASSDATACRNALHYLQYSD